MEAGTRRSRTVLPVQAVYFRGRGLEDQRITLDRFGIGVHPVGQEGEIELLVLARQVVDLQAPHVLLHVRDRREQRRHHDERAKAGRHAVAQRQPRQRRGVHFPRNGAVDQGNRGIDRRNEAEHCQNRDCRHAGAGAAST